MVMDGITLNLYSTSGLSILLHGVISLPDATPYDKIYCTLHHKFKTYIFLLCVCKCIRDSYTNAALAGCRYFFKIVACIKLYF